MISVANICKVLVLCNTKYQVFAKNYIFVDLQHCFFLRDYFCCKENRLPCLCCSLVKLALCLLPVVRLAVCSCHASTPHIQRCCGCSWRSLPCKRFPSPPKAVRFAPQECAEPQATSAYCPVLPLSPDSCPCPVVCCTQRQRPSECCRLVRVRRCVAAIVSETDAAWQCLFARIKKFFSLIVRLLNIFY